MKVRLDVFCRSLVVQVFLLLTVLALLAAEVARYVYNSVHEFYLLYAVLCSASFLVSNFWYLNYGLYESVSSSRSWHSIVYAVLQFGGVLVFLTDNLKNLILGKNRSKEPWMENSKVGDAYLTLNYVGLLLSPVLYTVNIHNEGVFLRRVCAFRPEIRRLRLSLQAYTEEKGVLNLRCSRIAREVAAVVERQRALQKNLSVPLLSFICFNVVDAVLTSGGLMKSYQTMTVMEIAFESYFFILSLSTLALMTEASEALDRERDGAEECLNHLILRGCQSGTTTEVMTLQEIRRQLSGSFCLHACKFVTLCRGAFLGAVGVLLSYCVILYQFEIN